MNGQYEAIVAAISHLDAATSALDDAGFVGDSHAYEISRMVSRLREQLNTTRVALLGNGQARPFYVAEVIAERSA